MRLQLHELQIVPLQVDHRTELLAHSGADLLRFHLGARVYQDRVIIKFFFRLDGLQSLKKYLFTTAHSVTERMEETNYLWSLAVDRELFSKLAQSDLCGKSHNDDRETKNRCQDKQDLE